MDNVDFSSYKFLESYAMIVVWYVVIGIIITYTVLIVSRKVCLFSLKVILPNNIFFSVRVLKKLFSIVLSMSCWVQFDTLVLVHTNLKKDN